ncbi:MAG: branched-chain amino acid ABC transporter permease [Anaerolineaceae bacterium]|nr:branched-chain amino acid ABC transporter permease [Anaerolineaceae bacterium]
MKKIQRGTLIFGIGIIVVFVAIQLLVQFKILNSFWFTIIRLGAVMAIVSLGLNLIYGFNGQFSLGQWAFYAIGAYASADATYRWTQLHSALGILVLLFAVVLSGLGILLIGRWISRIRGMDALSQFALYLIAIALLTWMALLVAKTLDAPVTALLNAIPPNISLQIVFFLSIILAGLIAAEVSFLFGLPVLTLGSDYFGIATLGLTIIVKVLLDNSDTMLGFPEMKGARGMIGIPKITTWFWVFSFLVLAIVITRNLLLSSYGRAIISVREDEVAAKAMGIDIAFYKNLTFVIGSFFAGAAGALYAHINGFLHPNTFNFIKSFDPLIIVVFGGLGSVTGTVAASFAWALVLEGFLRLWLPQGFETWRFVVYPLLLLIMMLLKPNGLLGSYEIAYLRDHIPSLRKKDKAQIQPPSTYPTAATDAQEVKS